MTIDALLLLATPDESVAAADFGATAVLGAVFIADRTFSLRCLRRLGITALSVGKRMAGSDTKAEQQAQGANPLGESARSCHN